MVVGKYQVASEESIFGVHYCGPKEVEIVRTHQRYRQSSPFEDDINQDKETPKY